MKAGAALGSAAFFALAPGVVAGVVPWALTGWQPHSAPAIVRVAGAAITVAGAAAVVGEFVRFVREGRGTPAPVAPTERLVVGGLYRYVRNPMYVAVVAIVLGQAMLFGSAPLLWYGAFLWVAFHLFVLAYEEPTLTQTYGAEYEDYRAHVRRWIPRLTAWQAGQVSDNMTK